MKKIISLLLSLSLLANTAIASDDITNLREDISDKLNSTVATLKEYFKKTNEKLIENKVSVDTAKETAQTLKESSLEKETNPVVLKQGLVAMPDCDETTQELAWVDDKWVCRAPTYGTDCYPASDEYRYEEDGKYVCSKTPQGESLNYYWKFRGYSLTCTNHKKDSVYDCFYNNKNNQEILVNNSYCANKEKPYVAPPVTLQTESKGYSEKNIPYRPGCINYGYSYNTMRQVSIHWNCNQIYSSRTSSFDKYGPMSHKIGDWTYHRGAYRGKNGGGSQHESYGYDVYRTREIDASSC
jgi:hypothetical protein